MGDIIEFKRKIEENVEIGKAKADIQTATVAVDSALQLYLATVYESCEILDDEEIMDIGLMVEAIEALTGAMLKPEPEAFHSFVQVREWYDNLIAYYETQGIVFEVEEDDDETLH